ncbi:hypothetical protein [Mycobacterium sp. AT1]|uniref:hypothetical protein n=1 Tax=Mycobacterium sp. AT1 TaxID=1961706 RepID=UPI0009ADD7E3|nr:hypothetical protein [Mycobacterium sp. AT1]OPX12839.1 hypothetical protein B1790_02880 [Mycobacterium sp. AT1]
MGTLDDFFEQHNLWTVLETMDSLLKQLRPAKDVDQLRSVARLRTVSALLREHQQKGMHEFYAASMLDNARSLIADQVIPNLNQFMSNPDIYVGHLAAAAANADTLLAYIGQWPAIPPGAQANAAGRAFSDYRKEAESAIEELTSNNSSLLQMQNNLEAHITDMQNDLAILEHRFMDSLQARENEYVETLKNVQSLGEEAFDKAIDQEIEKRQKQLEQYVVKAELFRDQTRIFRDEAEEMAESTKDAADWLAQRAVATDFGMQARRKSFAAWVYDVLGAAVIGTPLFFVLKHFLDTQGADGTVALSLTRLSIIFGAVILGGYLFSRGATNHRQARVSKSADIRLRTVEAFISKLEPSEQDRIRQGMARNIYLNGRLADDEPDSPNPFARLIDRVADGAKETKSDEPAP